MRELGDAWGIGLALATLGVVASARGDHDQAVLHNEEALALWETCPGQRYIDIALNNLGWEHVLRGDPDRSRRAYVRYLEHALYHEDRRGLGLVVMGTAGLDAMAGDPVRAGRLFAVAATQREEDGIPLRPAIQAQHDELVSAVRAALGDDAFATAWTAGRALPLDDVIAEVEEILAGEGVTSSAQGTLAVTGSSAARAATAGLTPREAEVLRLVVEGKSDKEIAAAMYISRRTASQHVSAVLAKLGAPSRAAAAVAAVRDRLV